jgi:phenylacetate-CoA ligase
MRDYPPPPYFQQTTGKLSEQELRALQNTRFIARMEDAWRTPFYAMRWGAAGIEPGDIRSLDDIEKLPCFTSDDLKDAIAAAPPFGSHQPVSAQQIARTPFKVHTSGGTTGFPRLTLFDPVALEVQAIQTARALWAQGTRPGDAVQITYTLAMANAGYCGLYACLHWLGAMPVTTGSGVVTPSERQLEYALKIGTTAWYGRAEYLARLVQIAQETNFDLRALKTKRLHSFLGPDVDGHLRQQLEEAWGCPVYDNYGTHEIGQIAFECEAMNGKHVNEDTVYLETADVETGAVLPAGERGNLVVTSLHRSTPPIIRYDLRDLLIAYERSECSCGLCTRKLSMFLGRSDEMVKLRGTNVYPMACQSAVTADPRATGEFLCVVSYSGEGLSRREVMTVRVEKKSDEIDDTTFAADMEAALYRDLSVRVAVEIVPRASLLPLTQVGSTGKSRRLLDMRQKEK